MIIITQTYTIFLVLDDRHRREIAELEEQYFFERENIVVSTDADQRINALSNWEYRFNQARLKLKQDHYNDLVEYLGKISPSTSQTLQRQNAEKEKKRAQLLAEKEQLDKALEAENKKFEAEQKAEISRKLAEEEARLEAELKAEQEKLLKEFENSKAEKELADEKEAEIKAAKARGASEEEMDAILAHWSQQEDKNRKMDQVERVRQANLISERLKRQKEAQLAAEKAKLEKQKKLEEDKLKNENLIKQTEILENMEKIEKSVEDDTKKIIKEEVKKAEEKSEAKPKTEDATCSEEIANAFGVSSPAAKTSSSISDEEFDRILKKSNLFEVIKLMKENLPNDPIEIMDPTESISNELIPCLLSSLSQKEKISFKFAQVFLLHLHFAIAYRL